MKPATEKHVHVSVVPAGAGSSLLPSLEGPAPCSDVELRAVYVLQQLLGRLKSLSTEEDDHTSQEDSGMVGSLLGKIFGGLRGS